jgi:hypothetical protein
VDLLRGIGRHRDDDEGVEMLDLETLRSRIGEPAPKKAPPPPKPDYARSDRAQPSERSWRKIAGLTR